MYPQQQYPQQQYPQQQYPQQQNPQQQYPQQQYPQQQYPQQQYPQQQYPQQQYPQQQYPQQQYPQQQYPQQQYPQQQYPQQQYPQQQYPQQQYPQQQYPQQQPYGGGVQKHPYQVQYHPEYVQYGDWRFDKRSIGKKDVKKYAREIFFQCDRDRSGFLDENEFWNALCLFFQKVGTSIPPQSFYVQCMEEYGYAGRVKLGEKKFATIIKDMTGYMNLDKKKKKRAKRDRFMKRLF